MSTRITRILCPLDFSEYSRHALEQAVAIARQHDARVIAMHAFALAPVAAAMPAGSPTVLEPGRLTGSMRAALEEDLLDFTASVNAAGVPVEPEIAGGDPVGAIIREAERREADLIVMGTHGRSGFNRIVLGSVAESVLRQATCPVLTVPPRAEGSTTLTFSRLLCAIDFSPCSVRAMEYAATFAPGAEILAVHVVHLTSYAGSPIHDEMINETPEVRQRFSDMAREHLLAAVPQTLRAAAHVREVVAIGRPSKEIVRVARDEHCDLVVLGVERRTKAGRLLFGSTTDLVLREAGCPVLTVLECAPAE